jgi:hypothetical protein
MRYITVITLAAAAGSAVAAYTFVQGRPRPNEAAGPQAEGHARALPSAPTAQTRLVGALGLVVTVVFGAGAIAALCFLVFSAVKHAVG